MDSPSTNKQGPRAPSSQASPARFRFVIGADAVYRSTRLRRYGIRSEPHKMNGRLEMSTGPVASPSAIAARVAADDTRSSACPPRAAERRRRRGWKATKGGNLDAKQPCLLCDQRSAGQSDNAAYLYHRCVHECMLDYKVSTNYT
uniref:Uncharacterized protein n=1 Tax=Oryza nivara TaxID=4536 RepID=A0A0E0GAR6_ORYNI